MQLFEDAGYDTVQALEDTSNDKLLAIDGISRSTVWEFPTNRLDTGSMPDISRY